ncbi:hypothetical protein THIX_30088 [Thiomonas sp. X19]|nr:hypothetical protein THIX_30088 [Thiomonas sp. X19]
MATTQISARMMSYLVATVFDYPDVRTYAVHRMHSAAVLDQHAQPPEAFDLDAYIASGAMQFGAGRSIRLKARIAESLAQVLRETPLAADQAIGSTRLGFCTLRPPCRTPGSCAGGCSVMPIRPWSSPPRACSGTWPCASPKLRSCTASDPGARHLPQGRCGLFRRGGFRCGRCGRSGRSGRGLWSARSTRFLAVTRGDVPWNFLHCPYIWRTLKLRRESTRAAPEE